MTLMADASSPPYRVALDGLSADYPEHMASVLQSLIEKRGLLDVLVEGIVELVPDPMLWRLTFTGNFVATVNSITGRTEENSYTTARGAGHAGAITIVRDDGTFDIVISADALFLTREDVGSAEAFVSHMIAAAGHLSRHEAGHAALKLRSKDADVFQNTSCPDKSDAANRRLLAPHIDDHRIERYTASRAPSPLSHVDHVADTIAHLRSELNTAALTSRSDIDSAAQRTLAAANSMIRVLAYLAAELGVDEEGKPRRPEPLPDGWAEYVEDSWDAWSRTFHRLTPVDQPMSTDDIGAVLVDLCHLMTIWLHDIGVDAGVTEDDDGYVSWTKSRY